MSKKILLADDSITIQKVIELTFSDDDYDVVTVGNGRLALEKLPEVRPDIVLCDIIMPERDGYEVCERIKSNPATAHIPVLLLTGAFEPFDQDRAQRAGADGSLAKPFEPETLIAKVKELLARPGGRVPAAAPSPPPPAPAASWPAPPSVFRPESPTQPVVPPPPAPSFIPEEPFGDLDSAELDAESGPAESPPTPAESAPPTPGRSFAPVTPEEFATLSGEVRIESAPADSASTVMFRAEELPWSAPPGRVEPPVPAPPATEEPASEAQPELEPLPGETTYEVIEEEFAFGPTAYPPAPEAPPPHRESTTVAFQPGEVSFPPQPVGDDRRREPVAWVPPPPSSPPPVAEAAPAAAPSAPVPAAAAESFTDVAPAEEAPAAAPRSEAAAVSVPVEQVERIAQRVVAQISEKVVREIAWEVIPDLAEALIKQEIERLKAELQKI